MGRLLQYSADWKSVLTETHGQCHSWSCLTSLSKHISKWLRGSGESLWKWGDLPVILSQIPVYDMKRLPPLLPHFLLWSVSLNGVCPLSIGVKDCYLHTGVNGRRVLYLFKNHRVELAHKTRTKGEWGEMVKYSLLVITRMPRFKNGVLFVSACCDLCLSRM